MYDETNVAQTLFKADAPYIYDGRGNYTFSANSLAILFNKIVVDNEPAVKEKKPELPNYTYRTPPKPASQPKPIDWGKVAALKRAGWSHKAIAEDVGAKVAVIDMYFANMEA